MPSCPAPLVLEAVSKRFRSVTAVDGVTWTPKPSTVTALVGPNGAGKSTLMRIAAGLVRPTSGTIHRTDRRTSDDQRAWSALIEAPALYDGLSVRRNLAVHTALTGATRTDVEEVVDETGISTVLARRAGHLSQGYRQRVALAIALLGSPRVVFLDEPTNALDPQSIIDLRHLIRALADRGAAVVVSSHLLRELEGVADHLLVLNAGRVLYDGPFDAFVGPGTVRVRPLDANNLAPLTQLVASLNHQARVEGSGVVIACDESEVETLMGQVALAAQRAGLVLVELTRTRPSLEERFHALIAEQAS